MITKLSLQEIQDRVNQLAIVINAPPDSLPTFGSSEQTGRPHIEVDSMGYHFAVAERGNEFERNTFAEIDELLYKIFAGVTFDLSSRYELAHRIQAQDCRRIIFRHQVELLSKLSPSWANLEQEKHQQILNRHPFDDKALLRATLSADLRGRGFSPDVAQKMVLEQYPLPEGVSWQKGSSD